MNLLFVGVNPSDSLERMLNKHQFGLKKVKQIPKIRESIPFQLVVVQPKTLSDLLKLKNLRDIYPSAWIALLVDPKWLKDTKSHNALLSSEHHNEVWLLPTWESTFWLSIQHITKHQKTVQAATELQTENSGLRNHFDELTENSQKLVDQLQRDISLATHIQRSILPKLAPSIANIDLAVKYLPAAGTGGDYYDIFELGDNRHLGILLADAQTHRMAANLLGALIHVKPEEIRSRFPDSKSFLSHLNDMFFKLPQDTRTPLPLFFGIFDRSTLSFEFTSAGPIHPILWRMGSVVPLVSALNPCLAEMPKAHFKENFIALKPGDLMIIHSNGLDSAVRKSGKPTVDQIINILKHQPTNPDPLNVKNELLALVDQWVGAHPLADDLTLIHLSIDDRAMYIAKN